MTLEGTQGNRAKPISKGLKIWAKVDFKNEKRISIRRNGQVDLEGQEVQAERPHWLDMAEEQKATYLEEGGAAAEKNPEQATSTP